MVLDISSFCHVLCIWLCGHEEAIVCWVFINFHRAAAERDTVVVKGRIQRSEKKESNNQQQVWSLPSERKVEWVKNCEHTLQLVIVHTFSVKYLQVLTLAFSYIHDWLRAKVCIYSNMLEWMFSIKWFEESPNHRSIKRVLYISHLSYNQ